MAEEDKKIVPPPTKPETPQTPPPPPPEPRDTNDGSWRQLNLPEGGLLKV